MSPRAREVMREGRESWAADFAFAERFAWDTQAGNPHTWQAEEVLARESAFPRVDEIGYPQNNAKRRGTPSRHN